MESGWLDANGARHEPDRLVDGTPNSSVPFLAFDRLSVTIAVAHNMLANTLTIRSIPSQTATVCP